MIGRQPCGTGAPTDTSDSHRYWAVRIRGRRTTGAPTDTSDSHRDWAVRIHHGIGPYGWAGAVLLAPLQTHPILIGIGPCGFTTVLGHTGGRAPYYWRPYRHIGIGRKRHQRQRHGACAPCLCRWCQQRLFCGGVLDFTAKPCRVDELELGRTYHFILHGIVDVTALTFESAATVI